MSKQYRLSREAQEISTQIRNIRENSKFWMFINNELIKFNLSQKQPIPIIINDKLYTVVLKGKSGSSTNIKVVAAISPEYHNRWYDIKFIKMGSRAVIKEGNLEGKINKIKDTDLFKIKYKMITEVSPYYFTNDGFILDVDKSKFKDIQKKYDIPDVSVKRDTDANTIEIQTAVYTMAKEYQEELIECAELRGSPTEGIPNRKLSKELIERILYSRLLQGYSLYSEFYIHRMNLTWEHIQLKAIKTGLHDMIPVAIKFAGKESPLYDKLVDKETKIIDNDYVTQKQFKEFQEKLLPIQAPTFFSISQSTNTILYCSKMDMEVLTGIRCENHSLEISNLILTTLVFPLVSYKAEFMSPSFLKKLRGLCRELGMSYQEQ